MDWVTTITNYYKDGYHTLADVAVFVQKGKITTADYQAITGQVYTMSLQQVQSSKIAQMQDFYNQTIYNTFPSTAWDGTTVETYACDVVSQSRINGEVTVAIAVKQGYSTETLSWKNVNQPQCVTWTADQMIKLGTDLHKFVTSQTDYLEALTVYINSLTTIDAVNAVTWGMTIPVADMATLALNTTAVPYTTIASFKLNVSDPQDYSVTVKGITATLNTATDIFGVSLAGTLTIADFAASDFVISKVTTTTTATTTT